MPDRTSASRCDCCGRFYPKRDPWCWDCEGREYREAQERQADAEQINRQVDAALRSAERVLEL